MFHSFKCYSPLTFKRMKQGGWFFVALLCFFTLNLPQKSSNCEVSFLHLWRDENGLKVYSHFES